MQSKGQEFQNLPCPSSASSRWKSDIQRANLPQGKKTLLLDKNSIIAKVKELFSHDHHPPEGWHRYSGNENTVCGQVMVTVSLSRGEDVKRYWGDFAGAVANRTWIDLRSIKDKHVSKVFKGEPTVASRRNDTVWKVITCC